METVRQDELADRVRGLVAERGPRCGPVTLIAVDGPSGSGKTTLAGELARALGAARPPRRRHAPGVDRAGEHRRAGAGLARRGVGVRGARQPPDLGLGRGRAGRRRAGRRARRSSSSRASGRSPSPASRGQRHGVGAGADDGAARPGRSPATARCSPRTGTSGPTRSAGCGPAPPVARRGRRGSTPAPRPAVEPGARGRRRALARARRPRCRRRLAEPADPHDRRCRRSSRGSARTSGLSSVWLGVLTTLPVLCMGLLAPAAARLGLRIGVARSISIAMVAVAVGNLVRGVLGRGRRALPRDALRRCGHRAGRDAAARAGQGLLPGRARRAGDRAADARDDGWRRRRRRRRRCPLADAPAAGTSSLGFWGLVAVVGVAALAPVDRAVHRGGDHDQHPPDTGHRLPWRSTHRLARRRLPRHPVVAVLLDPRVALPHLRRPRLGRARRRAAAVGLHRRPVRVGARRAGHHRPRRRLAGPARRGRRRAASPARSACGPRPTPRRGCGRSCSGPRRAPRSRSGMVLLVRYAVSPAAAARFTAMAFLFSYTVASLGPTTMGAVRDLTGGYSTIWLVLAVLMLVQIGAGPRRSTRRAPRPLTATSRRASAAVGQLCVGTGRARGTGRSAPAVTRRGRVRRPSVRGGRGRRRRARRGAGPRRATTAPSARWIAMTATVSVSAGAGWPTGRPRRR